MKPLCPYWRDVGRMDGGDCAAGLILRPSFGTCDRCAHPDNKGQGRMLPGATPLRVLTPQEKAAAKKLAEEAEATRIERLRRLWVELHARPRTLEFCPEYERCWLQEFELRVPCGDCKRHWRAWVAAHPPDLASSAGYFAWGWAAHDEVNRIRGVNRMDLIEAAKLHGFPIDQLSGCGFRTALDGPSPA